MKFAKVFQQVLEDEHIPEKWISSAIQYKALKKCINRVVSELEEFGLEKETLQALLSYEQASSSSSSAKPSTEPQSETPILSYGFEDDLEGFVPKLTVTIDTLSDLPVTASLSPATMKKLKHIADIKSSRISVIDKLESQGETEEWNSDRSSSESPPSSPSSSVQSLELLEDGSDSVKTATNSHPPSRLKVIEIKLKSDSEFFHMLSSELSQLDKLKKSQEKELLNLINELSATISQVVDPNKMHGSHGLRLPGGGSRRALDMYVWREIFREYIESGIFFSTLETDSGEHDAEMARQRLLFFAQRVMGDQAEALTLRQFQQKIQQQKELRQQNLEDEAAAVRLPHVDVDDEEESYRNETGPYSRALGLLQRVRHIKLGKEEEHSDASSSTPPLHTVNSTTSTLSTTANNHNKITPSPNSLLAKFRNSASRPAFKSFWILNNALLQALQFQAINKTAITKILKKFDKQTALTSRYTFPLLVAQGNHPFMSSSLAKSICFVIAERLLPVTPQIEDFLCPICTSLTFKPIRLDCTHVFCVRCLVQLQRANEDRCPICRQNVVLQADEGNLDTARLEYLKLYFPKEAKEKQAETERAIAKEQMDQLKTSGECVIQ